MRNKLERIGLVVFFMLFSWPFFGEESTGEKAMVVVITSYKNEKWASLNIRSVLNQKYKNYRVIYIDDSSPDRTAIKVERLLRFYSKKNKSSFRKMSFDYGEEPDIQKTTSCFANQINEQPVFFTLVTNKVRSGALANIYRAVYSCADEEIIVTLDGDDWFFDEDVLRRLNEEYKKKEIWLTHGNMIEYPSDIIGWCQPVPLEVVESNSFRSFRCPSHLRTFYAWLFKKIDLSDLLYQGNFFSMTWDMAMMYPMIEMAGDRHVFISQVNYVYNMINPINDNRVNAEWQRFLDGYIRSKKPYNRLIDRCDSPKN
jgi:glycosyltransferase involved in cell wall biosynthesis